MREVVAKLEPSEIDRFRDLDFAIRTYETGSVQVEYRQVENTYRAMLALWQDIYARYELEDEEYYEVNPINGVLYIDKD